MIYFTLESLFHLDKELLALKVATVPRAAATTKSTVATTRDAALEFILPAATVTDDVAVTVATVPAAL